MNLVHSLAKMKKRRIMVLSAGGPHAGVQCLYLLVQPSGWEVRAHAFVPYPPALKELLTQFREQGTTTAGLEELAALDRKVTLFLGECAEALLSRLPGFRRRTDLVCVNRPVLWKGPVEEGRDDGEWPLEPGSVTELSSRLSAPVLTDFTRASYSFESAVGLPLQAGVLSLSRGLGAPLALINIGLLSRALLTDSAGTAILVDRQLAPGTLLMNLAAREWCPDGFDRDGTFAGQGTADDECADKLCRALDEMGAPEKNATRQDFSVLLDHASLQGKEPHDKLATLTAMNARSLYLFLKSVHEDLVSLGTLWVSGGGSHNLTLLEYLQAYFDPVSVRRVETLGFPPEALVPAALGLSVNAYLDGRPVWFTADMPPRPESLGTWVLA